MQESKGTRTRAVILSTAVDVASMEGLAGMSIGRLAEATGMSKSGLFGHFGSKEELQIAIVDRAREIFIEKVISPSEELPAGLPRLYGMEALWIGYIEADTFEGGCFFAAASAEFDDRPGSIRKAIASSTRYWRDLLREEALRARQLGHLREEVEPSLLAFRLHAFVQEANWACQLLGEREAFDQARGATEALLKECATPEGIRATKRRRVVAAVSKDS